MNAGTRAEFADFFAAVHGHQPFPWQRRLAAQVAEQGAWPDLLDLPTGTGKTTVLDVALYALACRPDVMPRRILLVVDRRVVVDQGAVHANRILRALLQGTDPTASAIADRLRRLSGASPEEPPFTVAVLRGGMPRDEAWAERPDRPVIAVSTVDQVGSRLLFRGYGVSQRMAPIHAGLLGNDTLILLDEVQLATAFSETLAALHRRWRGWHRAASGVALPDRWGVVRMSATPPPSPDEATLPFQLDEADRAHPVLARRLSATKRAELRLLRVASNPEHAATQFSAACETAVTERLAAGATCVAVVVNRVNTAREIHSTLRRSADGAFDVALLTGRMRPLDRTAALGNVEEPGSLASRILAGRLRAPDDRPIVVVATQCIEAGADFDFDALVTECASLDALRQRFGRVDRRGELGDTRSTILARHTDVADTADDPVYGRALAATWAWLEAHATSSVVDFGVTGLPHLPDDSATAATLMARGSSAPILLPAHIDAWACTNPRPEPDPDVALWLHGPRRESPEVSLVWRADIDSTLLARGVDFTPMLELMPPSSLESLSLPLSAVRRWLTGSSPVAFGDVEGAREDDDKANRREDRGAKPRPCLRVHRGRCEILTTPEQLRPGDTVVVPATYGGVLHGNWDPAATTIVRDLGEQAQAIHRRRAVVRLHPAVHRFAEDDEPLAAAEDDGWRLPSIARAIPTTEAVGAVDVDARELVDSWLQATVGAGKQWEPVLATLRRGYRLIVVNAPPGTSDGEPPEGCRYLALIGRQRIGRIQAPGASTETVTELATEDDDAASFTGAAVPLRRHLHDVRTVAESFANRCGLDAGLAEDIGLAAWLHDIGKADPRFQRMLVGGSEVLLALQQEPLAKSSQDARDFTSRATARERSGYPRGYRHELLSVAMLQQTPGALAAAHDPDLVLHLVGSHHGWCRPFPPAVDHGPSIAVHVNLDGQQFSADTAHGLARLDSGVADRYFELVERYGWWGLAWLEAIVRLADHRASAGDSTGDALATHHKEVEA